MFWSWQSACQDGLRSQHKIIKATIIVLRWDVRVNVRSCLG